LATCTHIAESPNKPARADGCEECMALGQRWVHLRTCLECGHVGCCDSSLGKHASKHFESEGHPVMQSKEPGETWKWCFVDYLVNA
jgi:uncharacterized UBP type Zn finger protein